MVNETWQEDYNIRLLDSDDIAVFGVNVTHGSTINMTCKTEPTRHQLITCDMGYWTQDPLPCPNIGMTFFLLHIRLRVIGWHLNSISMINTTS